MHFFFPVWRAWKNQQLKLKKDWTDVHKSCCKDWTVVSFGKAKEKMLNWKNSLHKVLTSATAAEMHILSARAAFSLWAKWPGVVSALSILFGLHISWVSIGHSNRIERIDVFVQKCVCVLGSERNEGILQYCWAGQSATGWLEMSGATESRLMRIRRTRKARLFPFLAAHFYSRC